MELKDYRQPTRLTHFSEYNQARIIDALSYFSAHTFKVEPPYFLELGAGKHAADLPDRLCLDIEYSEGVELIWDLNFGIPLPSQCVYKIHSNQTLEHIHNIIFLFNEMWRVMKPGGEMWHAVPYYLGPHAWGDPTHVRAFSQESFKYYCVRPDGTPFVENFSDYGIECAFELTDYEIKGGNQGIEVWMKKPDTNKPKS